MTEPNPNPNPNPPQEPPKAKARKARVLVDCEIDGKQYKPNDVATFDDATLKAHADQLDATPAAVAYAESLKKTTES